MAKQQNGFTLIELVLVIVILGILAATALPRFSDLSKDARIATVNAMAASVKTGATAAHSIQLARAQASNATIAFEGATNVTMANGFPTAAGGGIDNTVDPGFSADFTFNAGQFTKNGAPDPTNCLVQYTASPAGAFPQITIASSGC